MDSDYEIRRDVPMREGRGGSRGLSGAIRRMGYGDSIVIPAAQQISAHACAKHVGAKVRTRKNEDGSVTIWRTDLAAEPEPVVEESGPSSPPKPFSYLELRYFFDKYVASHSVEKAVEILNSFGCNRITEAAALPSERMNELVDAIAGPDRLAESTKPTRPAPPPFKSAFVVTAPSPEYGFPSGYWTTRGFSDLWIEGPPPDAPPNYVPPPPNPSTKLKYEPPVLLPGLPATPEGLSFTPDDVPYLSHRHSTFRSIEGTRAILSFHSCDSTAEGMALPQRRLQCLCFAFVAALDEDNHPSLLESQPQLRPFFAERGWKLKPVSIFSGPLAIPTTTPAVASTPSPASNLTIFD